MNEPLSYKELETLVKKLQAEKFELAEVLSNKEKVYSAKENLYEQIINHTNEGVAVIVGDNLKFINQTALNLLKSTKSELDSVSFFDLIHPDYRGSIIQKVADIISGSETKFTSEIEVINKNSVIIGLRIYVEQILSNNSQVSLMVKFEDTHEINEKQLEIDSLKNTVGLFEMYMDEGIFILRKPDTKSQYIFSWIIEEGNNAALRILNKSKDEVTHQALNKFFIPDFDYQLPEELAPECNETFDVFVLNFKKYFCFTVFKISDTRLACKFQSNNDLMVAKKELNRNLQRNELITEILGIYKLDDSYVNRFTKILELAGYQFKPRRILIINNAKNDKQGKIYSQWTEDSQDLVNSQFLIAYQRVPSWQKMLTERKMILGFSFKYLPDDIKEFFSTLDINNAYVFPIWVDDILYGSILFENQKGNEWDNTEINYLKMVSVLISNLTGQMVSESNLISAKDQAEESDRLKSSFLANMSHDIRIPMTSIIGFSDLLVDEDLTIGEREEFVELISKSAQDLLTLVDNIVDMAKIETRQLKIQLDRCMLPHLFKDIYHSHIRNPKVVTQDDLDLILDFPAKYNDIPFETDIFRIKQIFNNLIDNAIKFTDKGEVKFGISNVWKKTIEFYVHDSGIGIAEETQHIIFKSFGKIDNSYTKEYTGTGLGLAICKSLVELLGGEIRVISYPTKGSTFYFTHPLTQEIDELMHKGTESVDKIERSYDWSNRTVLVVEDVEQNYMFLKFMFEATKAIVVWAQNGKEAVDYFKSGNPADIVLMDIRMPIMNGIEATKEITKISSVPIIAQTAYTLGNEKDLAIHAGCIDYVSKPIDAEKLLNIISKNLK